MVLQKVLALVFREETLGPVFYITTKAQKP